MLPVNGGTTSVVRVHSSVRSVVPQSARGAEELEQPVVGRARRSARRRAAIWSCDVEQRPSAPRRRRASIRSAKRSVGTAACSRRAGAGHRERELGRRPAAGRRGMRRRPP